MIGVVKNYSKQKKYGFISGDDGKEYFFHESEIKLPSHYISEGYTVQFAILDRTISAGVGLLLFLM